MEHAQSCMYMCFGGRDLVSGCGFSPLAFFQKKTHHFQMKPNHCSRNDRWAKWGRKRRPFEVPSVKRPRVCFPKVLYFFSSIFSITLSLSVTTHHSPIQPNHGFLSSRVQSRLNCWTGLLWWQVSTRPVAVEPSVEPCKELARSKT